MAGRSAVLLAADEVLYTLNGKIHLQGVYTGNIFINFTPSYIAQLVLMFIVETDSHEPFQSLTLEATLPGGGPVRTTVPLVGGMGIPGGRITIKYPLLISQALMPGRIEAKVIHEHGEIWVNAPHIQLNVST
jgi:hypothetical protein